MRRGYTVCVHTLLKECGDIMRRRPPLNVVRMVGSQMCPQCILGEFTPVLRAVHMGGLMWSDEKSAMSLDPIMAGIYYAMSSPT